MVTSGVVVCFAWTLLLPSEGAGLVWVDCYFDAEGVFRKKFLNVFWPFHNAEAATVKVVVETDFDGLLQFVDTVEVKVIHRVTISPHIFIHDGECR